VGYEAILISGTSFTTLTSIWAGLHGKESLKAVARFAPAADLLGGLRTPSLAIYRWMGHEEEGRGVCRGQRLKNVDGRRFRRCPASEALRLAESERVSAIRVNLC
jgi:hypothetical protein